MAATDGSLRRRVAAAVATLLGAASSGSAAKPSQAPPAPPAKEEPASQALGWAWEASFLQYNEADRIEVSEPQVGLHRNYGDGRRLSVLATVDTISGATPLGTLPLTPNTAPSTVTNASGHPINKAIGKVPTTDMKDTRLGLSGSYAHPLGIVTSEIIGGEISKEHDFFSVGGHWTVNRDFNQRNTTLSFGLSPEYDISNPRGGLPLAYGPYQAPGEFEGDHKAKYLVGGLIGLTQIISPKTLMQWNYSPTYENGYLNDPYKLLSIVNTIGDPVSAIHEKRPGSRLEHSLYWLTRWNMTGQDVFSLGLRYFFDNWGLHSQTIDFTYRWQYHERRFFEPHVRYYHQTSADFFRVGLNQGAPLPDFASADYRLNSIDGVTFGARMGWVLRNGSELVLRAEYYTQTGDDRPSSAVGLQRHYDLFPTLKATILQIDYMFNPGKLFRGWFGTSSSSRRKPGSSAVNVSGSGPRLSPG